MLHARRVTRVAFVLAILAGCSKGDSGVDLDDEGGNGAGTFRATVTGGAQFTVEGVAQFASSMPGANPSSFGLSLNGVRNGVSTSSVFALARVGAKRPGPGTLSIEVPTTVILSGSGVYVQYVGPEGGISSVTGTLTITNSTASRLQGSITFNGVMTRMSGGDVNVSVSITFDATCTSQCD
jgi:hypothetical protein